jgi:hypothetical protein
MYEYILNLKMCYLTSKLLSYIIIIIIVIVIIIIWL